MTNKEADGDIHGDEKHALDYARALAVALHDKHYPQVVQWEPLPDLLGLLTQIDNMAASLVKADGDTHGECAAETAKVELSAFEMWWAMLSKVPYMSKKEIASRAFYAGEMASYELRFDACRPYLKEGETVADALKRLSERKTVRSLCEAYEACKPFLKDGEAPAECLARNRNDIARLMGKWGAEKMTTARLRTALDKIAQTTGSDDPCRPLVQIARDALKRLTKELDAVRSELANAEDERKGQ